jgi:DNA-binding beta-propeller fold protein YncE
VPSEGPHGMGIVSDRLFCAADGQALVVLSRVSGEVIASLDLPGTPDVVMVDESLAHLYVAIGDPGVISVFDTRTLAHLETVSTEPGAHTIGINPAEHTVYAFLPASRGAAVLLDGHVAGKA